MLLDIQSRQQSLATRGVNIDHQLISNVFAFGISGNNKSSYVYASLSVDGLIEWRSDVDDSVETICFDLGSSLLWIVPRSC